MDSDLFKHVIFASRDGIVISDYQKIDNPIIYVNKAFENLTGYKSEEVIGKNFCFLKSGNECNSEHELIIKTLTEGNDCLVVIKNYKKDGAFFWNELSLSPVKNMNDQITHYISIHKDITDRILMQEQLLSSYEATIQDIEVLRNCIVTDQLTGTYNKEFFNQQLEIHMNIATRNIHTLGLFFVEIDFYKQYKSNYGNEACDELIKIISNMLLSNFRRSTDFVSRYEEDKFAILAISLNPDKIKEYVDSVCNSIFALKIGNTGSSTGYVTLSIGYTIRKYLDITNKEIIINEAISALDTAKDKGHNQAISHQYL